MAEEILTKDKGSIHNNKGYIPDDQRNKEGAHVCVLHYAGHGNNRHYISSELCVTKMFTFY